MATMDMEVKKEPNIETNGQDHDNQKDHTLEWIEYYERQALSAEKEGRPEEASLAKQWAEYYKSQMSNSPNSTKDKTISKSTDTSDKSETSENVALNEDSATNSEIKTYWVKVRTDFKDFNSWTYLLQLIENENKIENIREAMDSFLSHYPYCYGYWKKYADLVRDHEGIKEVEKVFERGIEAIPLSVDLWIHYLEWTIKHKFKDRNNRNDNNIRELFDRAINTCGLEFRSDKLWQMALDWESQKHNSRNVLSLYDRLIATPTQQYSAHYSSLVEIIEGSEPIDILPEEDYLMFKREIQEERLETMRMEKSAQPNEDAVIAATLIPATAADTWGKSSESTVDPHDIPLLAEEENKLMKDKMLNMREPIHEKTANEVNMRWSFEEKIKRPYFHVKPLEKSQLKNWHDYLDFEIKEGNYTRIVLLFERCIISCALYEEFWLKYANYMSKNNYTELARNIFRRACSLHLPMKVRLNLEWAQFEESVSGMKAAIDVLDNFEAKYPNIMAVLNHRLGILRRFDKLNECEILFNEAIASSKTLRSKIFWTEKYALFCFKASKNYDKARNIVEDLRRQENSNFHLAKFNVNLLYAANDTENLFKLLDECIKSTTFNIQDRLHFSQLRLEFLDDLSNEIRQIKEAKLQHKELVQEQKNNKRKTDDNSSDSAAKRNKTDQDWYNYSGQQWYGQQWMNYSHGNNGNGCSA